MTEHKLITDALGCEIVLGQHYGYSSVDGGWARTVQGVAEKVAPNGRVSLRVTKAQKFLYGSPCEHITTPAGQVHIRSFILFPIEVKS
jgi:hypothetical protein